MEFANTGAGSNSAARLYVSPIARCVFGEEALILDLGDCCYERG